MKKIIKTSNAPAAIGPYSQGVRAGDFVYCSGQIPLIPKTGEMIEGGVKEQTEQVLENLGQVLAAAGAGFADLVKTTIYLTDLGNFSVVNDIYGRYCGCAMPARATVEVSALPRGAMVEIEAVAYLGQ